MLIVDSREAKVIEILKSRNVSFTVKTLDIGDFMIGGYIIERKTKNDLAASIKDSRFREQKERLELHRDSVDSSETPGTPETPKSPIVLYVIEGNCKSKTNVPDKTLYSALLNLFINHNFNVLWTDSLESTCDILELLISKFDSSGASVGSTYTAVPNIKKCDKLMINKLACQLNTIPGISWEVSLILQEKYKTMNGLIGQLSGDSSGNGKGLIELANIQVGSRKFGKVLSNKVYSFLF